MRITTIRETWLKAVNKDSSSLPKEQKFRLKQNTVLVCTLEAVSGKSWRIKLAGNAGLLKANSLWWIYLQDWSVPNNVKTPIIDSVSKSNGLVSKIVPSKLSYVVQPDARTCQSASIAMITGGNVWSIRGALEQLGDPGNPGNMLTYLQGRTKEAQLDLTASIQDLRRKIDDGYQCILFGWFTGSGHVIKVNGYQADLETKGVTFSIDDPWYEFNPRQWTYAPWNRSGNNVLYSSHLIYAACVKSQSVSDAARIYNQGELDSSLDNMWLLSVKT
jgi:hypothetical protein